MTSPVSATIACGRFGGMYANEPACTLLASSPSATVPVPFKKCSVAGMGAVCAESSSPGANANNTAFMRSSLCSVWLRMPFAGIEVAATRSALK